jgi:hypothetical protein
VRACERERERERESISNLYSELQIKSWIIGNVWQLDRIPREVIQYERRERTFGAGVSDKLSDAATGQLPNPCSEEEYP